MKTYNCKHLLAVLTCLGLFLSGALAGDLAEVKEQGVLRVAVYKDFPPYSYLKGGSMQGIDVDIARALAERLGVGLSTMNLTASDEAMEDDLRNAVWKGHYLGGGVADIMMHVPVDTEFAAKNDQVLIFGPYFREQIAIAHDRERIPQMNNLLIFTREKVGVELETIPDMYLSRAERGRLVHNVVHYRYIEQACEALKNGETAAFMAPLAQLEDCVRDNNRFEISPVPARVGLFSWLVGMAVKSGNGDLAVAVADALSNMRADGSLKAIFARHGISYTVPSAGTKTASVDVER